MSYNEINDEVWDVVTMSFFGVNEEILGEILPLARRRVLMIMHGRPDPSGPLAVTDDGSKFSANEMEAYLKRKNYMFKKNVMEMQFGQPFKTIEEIHSFLSSYEEDEDFEKRMTNAEERIVKTNRFDYPYYLPKSISTVLFIILVGQKPRI